MTHATGALARIPGGQALIDWFGAVPSFHDGEVLSLRLERNGASKLIVSGHRMTSKTDTRGYFMLDRKFVATFELEGVFDIKLEGNDGACIVNRLSVSARQAADGYDLEFDSSYGLQGSISCKIVRVTFEPRGDAS